MKSTMQQQELTEQEFYNFISKGMPACDWVLNELQSFVAILQDAFDDSHSRSKDFISNTGKIKKANRQFYPQMMRFLVHNYLEADGIKNQLIDENDSPMEIEEEAKSDKPKKNSPHLVLASNGIAGEIKGYNYRVLKAVKYRIIEGQPIEPKKLEDILPPPGSNNVDNPKCKFYCQSHLKGYQQHLILPDAYEKPILKPNVIFVWDVYKNNYIKLYLAIPKWGNGRQVIVHDITEIKHPAETIVPDGEYEKSIDSLRLMEQKEYVKDTDSLRQQNKASS